MSAVGVDSGGSINTSGGGSINTSSGGPINTSNNGGAINTSNSGGAINTFGTDDAIGGYINTSGGSEGAGGGINTSNGGGFIDTTGTGVLQLGSNGTRSIIVGTATSNRSLDLPDVTGKIATTAQPDDYEVTDYTKGIILKSPNETRWRITINNDGTLSRVALALMTLLAFATSGLTQVRDMVTDASGNIVTGRTNVLAFTNNLRFTPLTNANSRTAIIGTNGALTAGNPPSAAAANGALLTADGAGSSSFVASRTQTVTMTNSAFRTNTTDTTTAVNGQTNMALSVDANSTYLISYSFIITTPTTGGWNGNLQTTPGTNVFIDQYIGRQGRPINILGSDWTASTISSALQAVNFARTNMAISGYGVLQTGTNAGTITLVWWQNTATNIATELQAGSTMSVTKIRP
jgi:hypothetical protein